ncbi:uncharacterized protein LOC106470586 isoform X2 [Limulus polyphemus]|uniref:Uncharacterized protein LOC106470586 isoform X2 n=1 Tax=Limulus polyphemus TaxID=6850 RepID=A0ABM1TGA3_LIMPO|nr:uncharacterized protein LOC106470586 isoform X2 [Limulus polyphemus]
MTVKIAQHNKNCVVCLQKDLSKCESLEDVKFLEVEINAGNNLLSRGAKWLPGLCSLNLSGSRLLSLRIIGTSLPNLSILRVSRCGLSSFDGIGNFTCLKELYASYNKLGDTSPCVLLEKLTTLDVKRNQISCFENIEVLSLCPDLAFITLEENPICQAFIKSENEEETFVSDDYRKAVKTAIPQLQMLDGLSFSTQSETFTNSFFEMEKKQLIVDKNYVDILSTDESDDPESDSSSNLTSAPEIICGHPGRKLPKRRERALPCCSISCVSECKMYSQKPRKDNISCLKKGTTGKHISHMHRNRNQEHLSSCQEEENESEHISTVDDHDSFSGLSYDGDVSSSFETSLSFQEFDLPHIKAHITNNEIQLPVHRFSDHARDFITSYSSIQLPSHSDSEVILPHPMNKLKPILRQQFRLPPTNLQIHVPQTTAFTKLNISSRHETRDLSQHVATDESFLWHNNSSNISLTSVCQTDNSGKGKQANTEILQPKPNYFTLEDGVTTWKRIQDIGLKLDSSASMKEVKSPML